MRGDILKAHGYSVVLYHCPLAVLHCDLSTFALAVIDFQMPGLNDRELFLRMRALGARFPIVLITGCVDLLSYEIVFTLHGASTRACLSSACWIPLQNS
jgi:FixJ family two-component response regulator